MTPIAKRYETAEQLAELPLGNYLVEEAPDEWIGYRRTEEGWVAVGSDKIETDADLIGIAIAGPLDDPDIG